MRSRLSIIGCVLLLWGCGELPHSNPVDPNAAVSITVHASRDTITAFNQPVIFTAESSPAVPDEYIAWSYGWPGRNPPHAHGRTVSVSYAPYTPAAEALWYDTITVTAWIGLHTARKHVTLSQRFGGIRFKCAGVCMAFTEDGNPKTFFYEPVDSLGSALIIPHPTTPAPLAVAAGIVSRDPNILAVVSQPVYSGPYINTATSGVRGSTWLVYLGDHYRDSVQIYTDLHPRSIELSCPGTVRVGQSVQATARHLGLGGVPLLAPIGFGWVVTSGKVTVDQTGMLTGVAPGPATLQVESHLGNIYASCAFNVLA